MFIYKKAWESVKRDNIGLYHNIAMLKKLLVEQREATRREHVALFRLKRLNKCLVARIEQLKGENNETIQTIDL